MNRSKIIILLLISLMCLMGCYNKSHEARDSRVTVIAQDMPYPTDQYVRIGYTLKMWEYEKEGLDLQQIEILDGNSKATLFTIGKKDIPKIYEDPMPSNPYYLPDRQTGSLLRKPATARSFGPARPEERHAPLSFQGQSQKPGCDNGRDRKSVV